MHSVFKMKIKFLLLGLILIFVNCSTLSKYSAIDGSNFKDDTKSLQDKINGLASNGILAKPVVMLKSKLLPKVL